MKGVCLDENGSVVCVAMSIPFGHVRTNG